MGPIWTVTLCTIALNFVFTLASTTAPPSGKSPLLKPEDDLPLESIKVNEGSKLKLRCRVPGYPRSFTTWYKDGEEIKPRNNRRLRVNRNSLVILQPREQDSGLYSCHKQNQYGQVWRNYSVTVKNEKKSLESSIVDCKTIGPPQFKNKGDLNDWIARPSQSPVALKCNVCGNPEPNVTWYVNGRRIDASIIYAKYKVKTKTSLIVESLTKKDAGYYTCVAQNEHGFINHTYELKVIDRVMTKPVIQGPVNQTVTYGDDVKFECIVVMSDLQPHIQWLKHYQINGSFTNEDDEPNVHILQQSHSFDLSRPEILYIRNVTYKHAGWYTCLVTNSMGRAYQSAWLTVKDPVLTKPVIRGLVNQTVTYRDDVKFECIVVTSNPHPHIQWLKHIQVNGSFTNKDFHIMKHSSSYNLSRPEILNIRNVTYEDAGLYTCLVANSMGRAYQSVWLTVEGPPQFKDKGDLNESISRPSQATVDFKCNVYGNPEPNLTWYVSGRRIDASVIGAKYKVKTKTSLIVESLTKKDAGNYTCVAQNEHGSINLTYELKVIDFFPDPDECAEKIRSIKEELRNEVEEKRAELVHSREVFTWIQSAMIQELVENKREMRNLQAKLRRSEHTIRELQNELRYYKSQFLKEEQSNAG